MHVENLEDVTVLYSNRFHLDNSHSKFNHEQAKRKCFNKEVNKYLDTEATNVEFLGHKVFLTDFAYLFPLEVQYAVSYEYKHHLHWFWCLVPRFDLPGVIRMITQQYHDKPKDQKQLYRKKM